MPHPLAVPIRQAIWRRFQDGQNGPAIAAALDLAPRTVRHLPRRSRRAGLTPAPAGRRTATDARRADCPHQVWQMDAAELVKLRTGLRVCWLRVAYECSGAVLWTAVFPRGRWTQVPPTDVQAQLRLA